MVGKVLDGFELSVFCRKPSSSLECVVDKLVGGKECAWSSFHFQVWVWPSVGATSKRSEASIVKRTVRHLLLK